MLKVHDKPANAEEQDEDSTLDELAREGARWMLMKALAVEITQYVEEHGAERDEHGRRPRPATDSQRLERLAPGRTGRDSAECAQMLRRPRPLLPIASPSP